MLQSPLLQIPGFAIHQCYLLKPRVVVTTYNHHVRLLSPGPLVGWHHQSLLGHWSRHCYGINYARHPVLSVIAFHALHASIADVQWVVESYALSLAALVKLISLRKLRILPGVR